MSLILGDSVGRATEYLIGIAFVHRTPEAMSEALSRLEGIRTLLVHLDADTTYDYLALSNEMSRVRDAINLLKKGKL
jgi:hypothetical protein